ncbi:Glyoxalase/Bleomycin resistance protein/Dihydroxybiphenyl dioxygenase [Zopfia rhizophila CBS 207.26]|uniref:Glyoxalase/Bleomycin resistance protein/Dihydroxybiphenyl dioxygenase n=1 Tax=Zopfia rhizophila CBS 207.26 TaxID=1314779 RepID=A0A6A6E204_9PEZI|nr:Glyoxalase/Bleomycin resistance protein/Dihydroxybiphenyl dioxygenase [Zopfia rhizophila CBS 207.26]
MERQADTNDTLPFKLTVGNDPPANPATQGYFINHICLLASNLTASRQWYSEVLGMRHIFTFDVSPNYAIMYMGHAQGGRNGTGFQTGAEMVRDKNNMAGLLELQSYKKSTNHSYTPDSRMTFSHIGLIVDDLGQAQARFDAMGVNIIKRRGELDWSPETGNRLFTGAWGFSDLDDEEVQKDIEAAMPGIEVIGFKELIIIADPDNNLIEVQALNPTSI